jgi:hypothetical protein
VKALSDSGLVRILFDNGRVRILSADGGAEFEFGEEAAIARVETLMLDASLGPLIDKLEGYLKKGGAKPVDRSLLKMVVGGGFVVYRAGRYAAEKPIDALQQLARFREPLRRMIEILSGGHDIGDVLIALGAPATLTLSPDEQALKLAQRRYEDFFESLDAIYHALPPPVKEPPHRRAKTGDLRRLVDRLADYWKRETGADFKQGRGKKGEALRKENLATTDACAFVWEIVAYVDRDALPSLPKAVEATVHRLRNSRK